MSKAATAQRPDMDGGSVKLAKTKKMAEQYYDRYPEHMQALEKSPLAKVRSLDSYDYYCLGKQLEQFEESSSMDEEQGNVNQLGIIPNVAFDVITAVQGASILPVIGSVQPIDEERGTVYFKQIRTSNTRGSQTAGQVVVDPRTNIVTPTGYANALNDQLAVQATTAANVGPYTFTLPNFPVKSESLTLYLQSTPAIQARDVGVLPGGNPDVGNLFGVGVSGTVNYTTGVVQLTFTADPGNSEIIASWLQNYELSTDIPQIDTFFDSKGILARIYALKGTIGMLQSYGMTKRFGLVAEDELAKDLVQETNREIGGDGVRKLRTAALANGAAIVWPGKPPTNVSYYEHKQTFVDYVAKVEAQLLTQAGRGTISVLIGGMQWCAVVATLPGFQKISDGTTLGSHVFGTYNGITVVRVVEANILGTYQGIALWRGLSPFEAALVYSPYMPLTVTNVLPQAPNPLQSMRACAVWAGVDTLVQQYAVGFDIDMTLQPS